MSTILPQLMPFIFMYMPRNMGGEIVAQHKFIITPPKGADSFFFFIFVHIHMTRKCLRVKYRVREMILTLGLFKMRIRH